MTKKIFNKLIDDLRLVAAIFVVAIHTAPFAEFSEFLAYLVTNVFGRLAVPFFFVLSGYFLFRKFKGATREEQYQMFLKTERNLLITYAMTLVIYIPVWLYLNVFQFSDFILDLFWNGIHYHLWYFPALIVGIAIVYWCYQNLSLKSTFILFLVLYIFGSLINVYGPLLPESFVVGTLSLVGNPRNGIFFAPLFVFIGQLIAQRLLKFRRELLLIVAGLFIFESLLIYFSGMSDPLNSMFLSLPIVIYYFVSEVLTMKAKTHSSSFYHNLSLYVYVIHPVIILGNRLVIGKLLNLELINTVNFVLTLSLSIVGAYVYSRLKEIYEKNK